MAGANATVYVWLLFRYTRTYPAKKPDINRCICSNRDKDLFLCQNSDYFWDSVSTKCHKIQNFPSVYCALYIVQHPPDAEIQIIFGTVWTPFVTRFQIIRGGQCAPCSIPLMDILKSGIKWLGTKGTPPLHQGERTQMDKGNLRMTRNKVNNTPSPLNKVNNCTISAVVQNILQGFLFCALKASFLKRGF